jgi:hypothetical protein
MSIAAQFSTQTAWVHDGPPSLSSQAKGMGNTVKIAEQQKFSALLKMLRAGLA